MIINKKKVINIVNLSVFLILIIGSLSISKNLYEKNHELNKKQIINEAIILNVVREFEYRNSMDKIKLIIELRKCTGEDTLQLDSLRTHIQIVNQIIKSKDSLYIAHRLKQIEKNGL